MASSPPNPNSEAGYATPAAMVFALGLALVAAALVGRSAMSLRLARADFARTRAEYALSGAHLAAAAEIVRSTKLPPFHWTLTTDQGFAEVHAEPEADKLSLAAASHLDDGVFTAFGVTDIVALKGRLADAAAGLPGVDVGPLDDAPGWRDCGDHFTSGFGRQTVFNYAAATEPGLGDKPASWRIGEPWRVRITAQAGWRDERIVRFTGDARHPAATVTRRFTRSHGKEEPCDGILKAVSAG